MNRALLIVSALSLVALTGRPRADDFAFHAGSTGTLGALNVTTNTTLPMPPDGIFNYTTITVATGAILRFQTNKVNTPVALLAQGDVDIEGSIDVSGDDATVQAGGLGGPGGFQGGNARSGAGDPPGAGHGPGGGAGGDDGIQGSTDASAGSGAFGAPPTNQWDNSAEKSLGVPYGSSLLVPLIGGSGGGGAFANGGGGGGGAILIASDTRIIVGGTIAARGGAVKGSYINGGSGGGIRLVAPAVSGSGLLDASGGTGLDGQSYGGPGRIRVDTLQPSRLTLTYKGVSVVGTLLLTFPPMAPQLDITEAAGKPIPVGEQEPVIIVLPLGSPAAQTVKVQGTNFKGMVPIRVALFPDNGPASFFNGTIDMTAGNPVTVTVNVTLPVNSATHVYVWNVPPAPAPQAARTAGRGGSTTARSAPARSAKVNARGAGGPSRSGGSR